MMAGCKSLVVRKARGFTLVELLIVVAIIAILALIGVANMSEATTRSKVSRVKADMMAMATAVETYAVDHNKYPVRHHRWERGGDEETSDCLVMGPYAPFTEKLFDPDPGETSAAVGLHVITTPIAYLTSLPEDVFFPTHIKAQESEVHYGWG